MRNSSAQLFFANKMKPDSGHSFHGYISHLSCTDIGVLNNIKNIKTCLKDYTLYSSIFTSLYQCNPIYSMSNENGS